MKPSCNFDPELALHCAKLVKALYDGDADPNVVNEQTDTQALVEEHHDGRWIVVFPGTSSCDDWRTDFRFFKMPWYLGGAVHRGFRNAYISVDSQIINRVPRGADVIISGHSLGGALATLCAHALQHHCNVTDAILLASPRVGNGEFARRYNRELGHVTSRVVAPHDPVPYVPLWIMGNRHVNTEVYLGDTGVKIGRNILSLGIQRLAKRKESYGATAHRIPNYIERLQWAVQSEK